MNAHERLSRARGKRRWFKKGEHVRPPAVFLAAFGTFEQRLRLSIQVLLIALPSGAENIIWKFLLNSKCQMKGEVESPTRGPLANDPDTPKHTRPVEDL